MTEASTNANGDDRRTVRTLSGNADPEMLDAMRRHVDALGREDETGRHWLRPRPLPVELPPVPPLPLEALPESLRDWMRDIAERMQCPPDYPVAAAIVALSSIVGRAIDIRPKRKDDWQVTPNLWGAIVGGPAMMKSPATSEALQPLRMLERLYRQRYVADLADYDRQKLVHDAESKAAHDAIHKAAKSGGDTHAAADAFTALKAPTVPVELRLSTSDTTIEKLADLLVSLPRGILVQRDELAGWFRSLDRQGREADRAFYLESWQGRAPFTVDRIGRGTIYVPALTVSVLGTIQPGPLSRLVHGAVSSADGADGLLQRFQVLVWPDAPVAWVNVDRWPDNAAKLRYEDLFRRLHELTPSDVGATGDPPAVRFTDEAQELFDAWRCAFEAHIRSGHSEALTAHLAKYRKLVPALALLFWLCDVAAGMSSRGAVDARALSRALTFAEYLEAHARRLYGSGERPGTNGAHELLRRLRKGDLAAPFTLREVYRNGWSGLSSVDEARRAVDMLLAAEWVSSERIETGGRPSVVYHVTPFLNDLPTDETDKTDRSYESPEAETPSVSNGGFDNEQVGADQVEIGRVERGTL